MTHVPERRHVSLRVAHHVPEMRSLREVVEHPVGVARVATGAVSPAAMWRIAYMAERMQSQRRKRHQREERSTHHRDGDVGQHWRGLDQRDLSDLVLERHRRRARQLEDPVQPGVRAVVDGAAGQNQAAAR